MAHIPPIRSEYPICITTEPIPAPAKRLNKCAPPKIKEEYKTVRKIPFLLDFNFRYNTVNIIPLNAISSNTTPPKTASRYVNQVEKLQF